ncbi:TPA: 3-deoxy-7-phosphoheptulonate synthase [Vibrio vulnificus]|uniref:3-deoxy-7-phosphoheptulonate synthase n=1 Tax=Vibrio vulnificus TaxID=672 RepID=UPI001A28C8AE|nr:3-deoxy-7-phosphoheptulonate synthase [Vibrio vulnificus]HAS6273198.1 3-deoxy-7-phosphoheptulonate synthase [Vibrio vulnificus]HDY7536668.1 3-deoxy-7-phosphoheptulonate synthase [Vibrio vulnificus]HDY8045223.1 3-deoxy-7-phosphoheptulonate synthase [Vibrio vulnificus]HDY8235028.1 3-deoxy-7-phosphoheptulonate synthase [Vibrio vulnificus]
MPTLSKLIHSTPCGTLPSVEEIIQHASLDEESEAFIRQRRQDIIRILNGQDPRLLVIIGPCSIHDPQAGLEYAQKLANIQHQHEKQLLVVMRTYFEKPRTRAGWKGLIVDPDLDNSHDINKGLLLARHFLQQVIKLGLATATEYLDTTTYPYISDLICWGAIGARTTESQIHRQMASALPCPIGFKNGTDGNVDIAIDAIHAANSPHLICVPGFGARTLTAISHGNPNGHIILRGGKTPNYTTEHVCQISQQLEANDLNPRLIIDCSHGNSLKVAKNQLDVARNIACQLIEGEKCIAGVMAESFLVAGAQKITDRPLVKGMSITDECLGWEETESILNIFAEAVNIVMTERFSTVA